MTYKSFIDFRQLEEFTSLLEKQKIQFEIEDISNLTLDVIVGQNMTASYNLKLLPEDFDRVNDIMDLYAAKQIENVDEDYYLFAFEDQELFEIIEKPDLWSPFDRQLALKILEERGLKVDEAFQKQLAQQRIDSIAIRERENILWIIIGYLSSVAGGWLGIIIGSVLLNLKKALPNGQRIFVYDQLTRMHGMVMVILGIVMALIWLFFMIFR